MRKNIWYYIFVSIGILLFSITPVLAETQQVKLNSEYSALKKEIDDIVSLISVKEDNLTQINDNIVQLQNDLKVSNQKIEQLIDIVKVRKKQAKERLIAIQTTDIFSDILSIVLSSQSITDFIDRLIVLSQLQNASNDKIKFALESQLALEQEKQSNENMLKQLQVDQQTLQSETVELLSKKTQLASILENNRQQLEELARLEYEEQLRLSQVIATMSTASTSVPATQQVTTTTQQTNQQTQERADNTSIETTSRMTTQATTTQQIVRVQGREFEVEATAYSYKEAGLTPYTATGIDLRINPKVIAVDPRVIPLGSMVHVHGYGVYLAADTGGAIKGNKIDVHMNDVASALQFGRRRVKVTILN